VRAVRVFVRDDRLEIQPVLRSFSRVQRVFQLTHPARLVIDVEGRVPRLPLHVAAPALVDGVRVAVRRTGTRVVVDLKAPLPGRTDYRIVAVTPAPRARLPRSRHR
jgi:hypothetical protein